MDRAVHFVRKFSPINQRYAKLAAVAALLLYAVIMLWPYLAATLVRGSAITAWTNVATAPIRGRAPAKLPLPGSQVGTDGVIFVVTNDRLDPGGVKVAEANLAAARTRTAAARTYLAAVQEMDHERRELMKLYTDHYRVELDAEIEVLQAKVVLMKSKVDAAVQVATRGRNVADSGYRSKDYRDEAQIRLAEAEADLAAERMLLDRTRRHRAAIDQGIYLAADGSRLNWAYDDWRETKSEVKRASLQLDQAQASEQEAEHALDAARQAFGLLSKAPVLAPPGATVRSTVVGAGATVELGEAVATWIDCNELFVDAPVPDAALPLIPIGSEAEAIIEGDRRWRKARVTNVRGGAETIGAADLAAVAKGRRRGDGQVLLRLDAGETDFSACPVGQAAYVHFPSAGLFDVLLARLGLHL